MLFLMTADTGKLTMFGLVLSQNSINSFMAGSAVLGGNIFAIIDHQGHMGFVAFGAALLAHIIRMRHMTVLAGLYLAVVFMAGGTVKTAVPAGISLELFVLTTMTGKTGIGQAFIQLYIQGDMRIDMTGPTVIQAEMPRPGMAAAAGRDNIHIRRGVALVTVQTDCTVGSTLITDGKNYITMALPAVILT